MRYKLHIPFAAREDLLADAVASVQAIGNVHVWASGIQMPTCDGIAECKRLPTLPYTAVHNLMFQYSLDDGDDVMFVMHADGLAKPGIAKMFRDFVATTFAHEKDWGVIFTHYDVLCAFNMAAVKDVGFFDPMFMFYMGDCDYYHRMRKAGWRQIEIGAEGVEHRCEAQSNVAPFKDGVGSATIKSDALFNHRIQWRHSTGFDAAYYRLKWGGEPEHETFDRPFQDFKP